MKRAKRIILLMLAGLMGASFVACGAEEPPVVDGGNNDTPTEEKPQVTSHMFLENGKSDYSLLLPANPSNAEITSASELNTFLSQATGITLPIVYESEDSAPDKFLSIGKTEALKDSDVAVDYAELLTSGYVVKTVDNDVYIAGGNPGVVYGAYEFLEEMLGYHYYSDNIYDIRKNVKNQALLDFNVKEIPAFQYRCDSYGFEQYSNKDSMYSYRMRLDESLSIYGNWHNFFKLVPNSEENRTAHPNWFTADGNQFCLTRDRAGLAGAIKDKVIEALEEDPTFTYFHVGMEDTRTWCDCDTCTETIGKYNGYVASTYILFMNEVYAQLKPYLEEHNLDTKLTMFAYHRTQSAPVEWNTEKKCYELVSNDLKLSDGVHIVYAPIESDYFHPFTDPNCPDTEKDFTGWSLVADRVLLWTYSSYFNDYMLPQVSFNSIQQNYQLARDLNVLWIFNQAEWNNNNSTGFGRLKAYVNAQLAWNPDQDLRTLIKDFCNFYFGDAADSMLKILDSLLTWRAYCAEELGLQGAVRDLPNDEVYWPYQLVKGWLDEIDNAYAAIEKYKTADVATYERLHDAITLESLSFRYILITYQSSYFTEAELLEMQKAFKMDAIKLNVSRHEEHDVIESLYRDWGII